MTTYPSIETAAGASGSEHTSVSMSCVPAWRICRAGAAAAASGAVVLFGYGAAAQRLSVPMMAGDPGAAAAQPITPLNFAVGTLFCTILGTVLAAVLGRYAARPGRTFVRAAITLLALSLVFPAAASHTAVSTRVCLALAHLIAAAIVVPQLARALRR